MSDQEKTARLASIPEEIEALIQEGIKLADELKVTFNLGATTFADEYGMGGYRYVPEDSPEAAERQEQFKEWFGEDYDPDYGDFPADGWLTSSSDCN